MHDSRRFRYRLALRIFSALGGAALVAEQASCADDGGARPDAGQHTTDGAARHDATRDAPRDSSPRAEAAVHPDASQRTDGGADARDATADDAREGGDAGGPDGAVGDALLDGAGASDADVDADAGDGGTMILSGNDCFAWPAPPLGDAAISDAGPVDAGPCPTDATTIVAIFEAEGCPRGFEPRIILAGPIAESTPTNCCYTTDLFVCGPGGRPYLVDGRPRVATVARAASSDWIGAVCPRVEGLTGDERRTLAEAWTEAALFEHASVASFARFSLDLLAVGAPPDLVAAAHSAAGDEIEHARLCFALATAYAGAAVAPGQLALGDAPRSSFGLQQMVQDTIVEGCAGETVAAWIASEQCARATDPAVCDALTRIANDEARHAELAWRAVAWAVRVGGSEVRDAAERAVAKVVEASRRAEGPASMAVRGARALAAHGLLDEATRRRVAGDAMERVILPAARVLLASAVEPASSRFEATGAPSLLVERKSVSVAS